MSLKCRRCNGMGHTQSHCPDAVQVVTPVRSYSRPQVVAPKKPKKKQRPSNGFATLADLSSDEESDINSSNSIAGKTDHDIASQPDGTKPWFKQSAVNWCDEDSEDE